MKLIISFKTDLEEILPESPVEIVHLGLDDLVGVEVGHVVLIPVRDAIPHFHDTAREQL